MKKEILIIDDSKIVRQYHKEILQDMGYGIDEAENGMEALEKSLSKKYSLFLVDVNMPIMDGYTFIEKIRKLEHFFLTPIIMISTEAEEMDKKKAYEVGATLYYIKPIKPDILGIAIKVLLS